MLVLMEKKKTGLNLPRPLLDEFNRMVKEHGRTHYRIKGALLASAVLCLLGKRSDDVSSMLDRVLVANSKGNYEELIREARAAAGAGKRVEERGFKPDDPPNHEQQNQPADADAR